MFSLITAFLITAIICLLIIRYTHVHVRFSVDNLQGPQKVHVGAIPRVGGVGIYFGILAASFVPSLQYGKQSQTEILLSLLIIALPVFLSGLAEDLTKRIPPSIRLFCAGISASIAFFVLDAQIKTVGIPLAWPLLHYLPFVFCLTILAVSGVTHAINIIDGFNGLAGGVCLLSLFAISYVAFKVNDLGIFHIGMISAGGMLGFLIWNYPAGLIFLGDGGAYLAGFIIAEASVLLVARHPQVSPWFPVLVLIYPVVETLYTIYRRTFIRRKMPDHPDALHLHSLIYRRLLSWMLASKLEARDIMRRNAMTAPYLWGLTALCVITAVVFYSRTGWLVLGCLVFVYFYVWIYTCIITFRTPIWLRRLLSLNRRRTITIRE